MGAVVALDALLDQRRIWKGRHTSTPRSGYPTGNAGLDAMLPSGGWPLAALSEILLQAEGTGELRLLWPTLARLTQAGETVVLVAPPHVPFAPAWHAAGIDLRHLMIVNAQGAEALWAAEQCLRTGCNGAVLCWPQRADDRSMRRLQVAAETGQTLAFAYRPAEEAVNPSPAALRLLLESATSQLRVLKCRGGIAPAAPLPFVAWH
ncbi:MULTISPECIES: translesion DNA synthesis-associated protein ImuA [Pseudomonas]|uniref:translesion DNA synthesis-associated protein ImuA n=1 Tax=Pseudomonas TaxID=286 RepID=UPI00123BD47F|nr:MULTISPECIES: translesion DNA synthesis-associated protein ImuA [Pseudomonas]QIB51159.1 translesion DNA synthesis-associated protein ImuA [Pseudomonas sp. OIL-1]